MTAKENAIKILNQMQDLEKNRSGGILELSMAKAMANFFVDMFVKYGTRTEPVEHWQQVKEELNKL